MRSVIVYGGDVNDHDKRKYRTREGGEEERLKRKIIYLKLKIYIIGIIQFGLYHFTSRLISE